MAKTLTIEQHVAEAARHLNEARVGARLAEPYDHRRAMLLAALADYVNVIAVWETSK